MDVRYVLSRALGTCLVPVSYHIPIGPRQQVSWFLGMMLARGLTPWAPLPSGASHTASETLPILPVSGLSQTTTSASGDTEVPLSTIPVPGSPNAVTNATVENAEGQSVLSILPAPGNAATSSEATVKELGPLSTLPAAAGLNANEALASGENVSTITIRPLTMLWQFCFEFPHEFQIQKRQVLGRFMVTTAVCNFPHAQETQVVPDFVSTFVGPAQETQAVPGFVSTFVGPVPAKRKLSCPTKRRMPKKRSAEVPSQVSTRKQALIKEYFARQPMGSQDAKL